MKKNMERFTNLRVILALKSRRSSPNVGTSWNRCGPIRYLHYNVGTKDGT